MFEDLKGKRLLFLGAIRPLCEAVEYAKEMGIHTVVIDWLPNSPAKALADEAYLVSTTDIDAVCDLCREKHIDGIFTGYMDNMLSCAREICDRMGYPFYATHEQIRLNRDKSFFKQKLSEYGIGVPVNYTEIVKNEGCDSPNIRFPVIVKPIDRGGGIGITVCNNAEQLRAACEKALQFSISKTILVEEYLSGVEINITYTFKDGQISLSTVKDKYISRDHTDIQAQGDILFQPSAYLQQYVDTVNEKMIRFFKGMGARDGCAYIQGVANKDRIALFEIGYRPNNSCDYRHISMENGINYLKMMIAHALTGRMEGYELSMDNPFFSQYSVTLNIWGRPGVIGKMEGLEEARGLPHVALAEYKRAEGDTLTADKPYQQCVFRAIIRAKTVPEVKETIREVQKRIRVWDAEGKDMLYKPFDVDRIDTCDAHGLLSGENA